MLKINRHKPSEIKSWRQRLAGGEIILAYSGETQYQESAPLRVDS